MSDVIWHLNGRSLANITLKVIRIKLSEINILLVLFLRKGGMFRHDKWMFMGVYKGRDSLLYGGLGWGPLGSMGMI